MSIHSGEAEFRSRMVLPKRPNPRRGILAALMALTVVVAAGQSSNYKPYRSVKFISPSNTATIDRDVIDLAGVVHSSNQDLDQVSIVLNGDTRSMPLIDSVFRDTTFSLQPGINLIGAVVDDASDVMRVIAPRSFYHFDEDEEAWLLTLSNRFQPTLQHQVDGQGNGFLSTVAASRKLDLMLVVDGTGSMTNGLSEWTQLVEELTTRIKGVFQEVHIGLVVFRDHEILYEQELSTNALPKGVCKLNFGGDLTEDMLPAVSEAIDIMAEKSRDNVIRHIVAITDAPSKEDTVEMRERIQAQAIKHRVNVHTVIVHPKPVDESNLSPYSLEVQDEIRLNNTVNETLSMMAMQCGQALSNSANGVFVELKTLAPKSFDPAVNRLVDAILKSTWSWRPPREGLISLREAYGENILVSLKRFQDPQLVLEGSNQSLTLDLESVSESWKTFRVPLHESDLWRTETGEPPDLRGTLETLVDCQIRATNVSEVAPSLDRFIIIQD